MSAKQQEQTGMRLDKWLWAARFFKTRKLAVEAVNGGKVHLDGQRTKPGKEVHVGTRLQVSKNSLEWDITIEQLPTQRRPASEAVTFYPERDESKQKREKQLEEQRLLRASQPPRPQTRPSKRDRRLIHRFKQGD